MCWPSTKQPTPTQTFSWLMEGYTKTKYDMTPTNAKRFIKSPYSIPRAIPIDSDGWCRLPTASVLGNKLDKPRSDQAHVVSEGHTLCRKKENYNTEVHDRGGLELVKLAREPASSHPKPFASLGNDPRILFVRRSLLAVVGKNQTVV